MANQEGNYQLYKRYVKNIALIYNRRTDVQTYVELMLSISVIVIFGMFAIRPTFVTIGELRNEIQGKEQTLDLLNKKVRDLDTAQTVWNQNRTLVSLIDTAVPNGPLPVSFARQIEGIARKNNTSLNNVSTERIQILGETIVSEDVEADLADATKTDRYPSAAAQLEFSFDVVGEYQSGLLFISDLERLRRPIFIDRIRLRSDVDDLQGIIISVSGRVPYVE